MVDQDVLCLKASRLRQLLVELSPSSEAARALLGELNPLLEKAISKQVTALPDRHIPGGYMVWSDDAFHDFPEVEEAYAQFQNQILSGC